MQIKEVFVTKVNSKAVKAYLAHFYRGQDYRLQENESEITVIPYSYISPFEKWQQDQKRISLTYRFIEKEHETDIEFTYQLSFFQKVIALVLPLLIFGIVYLMIRMNFGLLGTIDFVLLAAAYCGMIAYSYFQAKNIIKHDLDKNKTLLKELEFFAAKHLHKGLLNESFREL